MKLSIYFIIYLFSIAATAQIINFPDANFKDALVNTICADFNGNGSLDGDADTNNDGEIDINEAQNVRRLVVNDKNITSMEGLQYFSNIFWLSCNKNELTSLDVSALQYLEILVCYQNELTTLDLSSNLRLKELYCTQNNLTSLHVNQCIDLEILYAQFNSLTVLDLTELPKLKDLNVQLNNLTSLDVSQNPLLEDLNCGDNQIAILNLSENTLLDWLVCINNILETLDLRNNNNTILATVQAEGNPFLACILVDDEDASRPECDHQFNEGWCIDPTVSYSENCTLDTDLLSNSAFSLFPNPATNVLNINVSQKIDQVKINSINGVLVFQGSESTIETSNLSAGMYIITVRIAENSSTQIFIKK